MDRADQSPSAALTRLVNGYQVTQAIHVAATLGLADLLADGPRASDDLAAATDAHPAARGILFDQPQVVAGAEPLLRAAGVADRCRVVRGDFFAAVPEGADAYVLKSVIHDWDDERSIAILRACRRAARPDATLLVVDRVIGRPNEDALAKFTDLNMLVGAGGRERTREEWGELFEAAGFRLVEVAPAGAISVIEGRPA